MKYKILLIIGLILSINLVSAINGALDTNLTQEEFENLGNTSANLFINQNLNATGFLTFGLSKTIYGNFTIKTLTVGTERKVSGFLENVVQMTSYAGDFYKYPGLNLSSEVTYAGFIASERFLNETECVKIPLGLRAESVEATERNWWQRFWYGKRKIIYYPISAYVCEQHLQEVSYYPN